MFYHDTKLEDMASGGFSVEFALGSQALTNEP